MQYDLKMIKKKYGEKMSHLCRTLFPSILETEGLLYSLLKSKFHPSRFLYDDLVENNLVDSFKNFIFSLLEIEEEKICVDKTPRELLDEAGYDFYECKTYKDVRIFEKYYRSDEKLCTFDDIEGRLDDFYVFFAVKKNVYEIIRENFSNPDRQDDYGTSVISIQFTKGDVNTISIKNRYNHTVQNPDATFSNNLDNIIKGLTESFEQTYNLNINGYEKNGFEIPGYVKVSDGKFYKYNYEISNIYYGPDNIIIDNFNVVEKYLDKGRYLIFDYFVLDMKEKAIELYDRWKLKTFIKGLSHINSVKIRKEKDNKYIYLEIDNFCETVVIVLNKQNKIISYTNNNILEIGDDFLRYNDSLISISLENVREIGHAFLEENKNSLKEMILPLVKKVGTGFLKYNNSIDDISMPKLERVGRYFLYSNNCITRLDFPELRFVDYWFLSKNKVVDYVHMSNLEWAGAYFLEDNLELKELILPKLEVIQPFFMEKNNSLTILGLPNLKSICSYYLEENKVLTTVIVPDDIRDEFIFGSSFKDNFIDEEIENGYQKRIGTI